ncbi:DUF2358 family protein [Actinidia rufa]|uniref:DUF2358 family protein n=1 Tax=Actinidia rufa TaxID=165716 RepID=A0A7J0DNN0_9ERIC|nr:DUF2358 family protein [Actinidia rufa]
MAVLVPSVEVSSVSGNRLEFPANFVSKSVRSVGNQTVWKKNSRGGVRVRVRVCSRIKDSEVEVSDLGYNLGLYGLFSAPEKLSTTSLPKQSKEEEEKQNYHVNTGYAIRTLREEFPELFYKELSFDIYRDDIVFKDPLNTFVGIENYKSIFWALRFHGRIFFRALFRVMSVDELIQSIGCPSTPKPTYFEISPSPKMNFVALLLELTWVRDYLSAVLDSAQKPNAGSSRQT